MKKNLIVIYFITISAVTLAQTNGWFSAWGEAGYSRLNYKIEQNNNLPKVSDIQGFGAGLGLGYEFHYKKFIATVGIEGNYWNLNSRVDNFQLRADMIDTEGIPYTGVFDLTNNTDRYQAIYVNFPLMAGFQLPKNWYFLIGAKYGLNIFGKSITGDKNTTVNSYGIYEQYIEPFTNMENHDFLPLNRIFKTDISFKNNLAASLEIGKYLLINNDFKIRVAAFIDYGLLNIHKNRVDGGIYINDPVNSDIGSANSLFEPRYNALLLSDRAKNQNFTPMFIGLKFTFLFKLHQLNDCKCEW